MRFRSTLATLFGRQSQTGAADMLPLEQASDLALEAMRRRKLPLARVALAGRTETEARLWVANNMLRNAAVLGRSEGSSTFEHIADGACRGLTVRPDWSGAAPADADSTGYGTLCVPRTKLEAYLGWAGSVA